MAGLPFFLPSLLPGDPTLTGYTDPTGGLSDGTLAEIVDLCGQSEDLLIRQYADSTRLKALLCALLDPLQVLETATCAVYAQVLNIEGAAGVHLDLLGRIVGEARNGLSDYVYRRAIKTRVLINRSQGRIPDLIAVARMFEEMDDPAGVETEPGAYVRVSEVQPARIEVRIVHTPANDPGEVHKRVRASKAAGIALTTMVLPEGAAAYTQAFRLIRAADYPEKNTTEGLCPAGDRTAGGFLSHALA